MKKWLLHLTLKLAIYILAVNNISYAEDDNFLDIAENNFKFHKIEDINTIDNIFNNAFVEINLEKYENKFSLQKTIDHTIDLQQEIKTKKTVSNMTWSNQTLYDAPYTKVLWKGAIWENIFSTIGEEPNISEVWRQIGVSSKDLNSWNSEYVYQDIDTAIYWKGFVWRNTAYTVNEEPGESEVWNKIGLSGRNTINKWSFDVFYKEAGEVVFWNGRSWRSTGPTKGSEPGKFNDWERVGYVESDTKDDKITWQINKSYNSTGIVVKHNSIIYSSRRPSIGEKPGTTDAWAVVSIATDNPATQWMDDRNYNINNIVIYDNKLWQAAYENRGERPSYAEEIWNGIVIDSDFEKNTSNLTDVEQLEIQTDNVTEWSINKSYPKYSRVIYKEKRWESLYYSLGDIPGESIKWVLLDKPVDENGVVIWMPYEIYQKTGLIVSHNGKIWRNKWYTVGDEPGINDVWSNSNQDGSNLTNQDGIVIWQSDVGYEKTLVVHNGKYYKNKWYVDAGVEPGQSNIWYEVNQDGSNLTNQDGIVIWQSNVTYKSGALVVHNGKYYKNKWYVDAGVEPEQSNIWYEVNQDGSNLTNQDGIVIWQSDVGYEKTLVVHNGKYYKNKWYVDAGVEPGQSNIWYEVNQDGSNLTNQDGIVIWQSNVTYKSGALVIYHDKYYKNKWYVDAGVEPEQSNIWYEVNQDGSDLTGNFIIWDIGLEYQGGTLVKHNDEYYKNRWYANAGAEPGRSNIWYRVNQNGSDLTDQDGIIIWQYNVVYDQIETLVVHNGEYYKNQWYASAGDTIDSSDEPGRSDNWYKVDKDGNL